MYEYTTLPNSWEEESLQWDHYYAEQYLGSDGFTISEFERLTVSMHSCVEVMKIEEEMQPVMLPRDVYDVYMEHHLDGRDLPCKQLS